MLAEAATTDLSKEKSPQNFDENATIANEDEKGARVARQQLEKQFGHALVTPLNAKKGIKQNDTKEQIGND